MPRPTRINESEPAITPNEAAWLTELPAKAINAMIDRGELPGGPPTKGAAARRSRRLGPADVVYLALRKEIAELLSAKAKAELYQRLAQMSWSSAWDSSRTPGRATDLAVVLAGGLVKVDLATIWRRLMERWAALEEAKRLIVSDPDIRGGEPVLRGTRIPAHVVAELVRQGATPEELKEDFPSLSAKMVRAAITFACTNPRRGRPAAAPWRN